MINLKAYSTKDLQHFAHILNQFEANGCDIPTARKYVAETLAEARISIRTKRSPANTHEQMKTFEPVECQEEGCNGILESYQRKDPITEEFIILTKCSKCQKSFIVEDII